MPPLPTSGSEFKTLLESHNLANLAVVDRLPRSAADDYLCSGLCHRPQEDRRF